MLDKLTKAFGLLRQDFNALRGDVQRLEKVRPIVKHGKDGVSPDPEAIVNAVLEKIPTPRDGVSPDIAAVAQEAAKLVPAPKDGRDAIAPTVRDVADVVLANIEKPKDGISPDIAVVAQEAAKLIPAPKDGVSPSAEAIAEKVPRAKPGPPGKDGKDGVSVTDVQLKNNNLFVFLNGIRKNVGKIELPKQKLAFTPGGGGGRGGSSKSIDPELLKNLERIRPIYADMVISGGQSHTFALTASADPALVPPSTPQPVGPGPYDGWVQVTGFAQTIAKGITVENSSFIVNNDGVWDLSSAWFTFQHSQNSSTVAYAGVFEIEGQLFFDPVTIAGRLPNNNTPLTLTGGGIIPIPAGASFSVWMATDTTGTVTVPSAALSLHMLEDTSII